MGVELLHGQVRKEACAVATFLDDLRRARRRDNIVPAAAFQDFLRVVDPDKSSRDKLPDGCRLALPEVSESHVPAGWADALGLRDAMFHAQ